MNNTSIANSSFVTWILSIFLFVSPVAQAQGAEIAEDVVQAWNEAINAQFAGPGDDAKFQPFTYADAGDSRPVVGNPLDHYSLEDSLSKPVDLGIELTSRFGGGANVYGLHVFPKDFFVRNSDPIDWSVLTQNQPWFEWKSAQKTFQYHTGGAQEQILKVLSSAQQTIKLYRGTTLVEAEILNLVQDLGQNKNARVSTQKLQKGFQDLKSYQAKNPSSANRDAKLKSIASFEAIVNQILQNLSTHKIDETTASKGLAAALRGWMKAGQFAGVFVTEDKGVARVFSKGAVIELEISTRDLQSLNQVPQSLYLGMETSLEIAFISDAALNIYIHGFSSYFEKEATNIWNK